MAIPGEVIDHLGLKSGEDLAIVIDRRTRVVMIGSREKFGLKLVASNLENGDSEFEGLKSPFSEEDLLELLNQVRTTSTNKPDSQG